MVRPGRPDPPAPVEGAAGQGAAGQAEPAPDAAGPGGAGPGGPGPAAGAGDAEPPVPSWAPPAAADVPPGAGVASQRLAGYLLEEQIGLGGMAVVYRATDERLGRRVALKLLAPALAQDTGFRQRFIRESRAAAAVDHPNIIPIYEAGETDGALFIAMRYVQGGDVRSLLERESPLSPDRVWSIVSQVASALDAAHEHDLVHRDVKPGNMLLDASGGRGWTRPASSSTSTSPTSASASSSWPAPRSPRPGSSSARSTTSHPSRSRASASTDGPTSTPWPARRSSCWPAPGRSGKTPSSG